MNIKRTINIFISLYKNHPVIVISGVAALLLPPFAIIFLDPGLSPRYYGEIALKFITQWPESSILSALTFFLYPLGFPSDNTSLLGLVLGHYLITIGAIIVNYLLVIGPIYLLFRLFRREAH